MLGARNTALSGASLTLDDEWSTANNVGVLGRLDQSGGAITYQNRYNVPEFMVIGGSFAQHWKVFNTGLSYYRFGGDLYNEQKVGLAVGNSLQMVSLGAGINMIQFNIEGLGSWQYWVLEFGGTAQLTDELMLGAHIFNISAGNGIPIIMKAGFSYRPLEELMINVETHKSIDQSARFVGGIEYLLIRPLAIRTGISTVPFRSSYGLGIFLSPFNLNYAFSDQADLGAVHEFSINFSLIKQ